MMSMKGNICEPLAVKFQDVSRTHPHYDVLRTHFYVESRPQKVLGRAKSLLAKRSWHGVGDAGQTVEFAVRTTF